MLEVSATEFAKRFARYRRAAQTEPVAVTHHGETTEVLVSRAAYEDYMKLRAERRRSRPMTDQQFITALEATRMDAKYDHLNALMDEG